ncbi:STAS domain-containing protein [Aquisphaera insulae]|uniref:STAS domain-containing protein n=1 Tax=Aquisphaera insulae TaxID=2712864 RepID=UPI00202EBD40|nr:STAS domain-containing protein [Aquisphaera insulae]
MAVDRPLPQSIAIDGPATIYEAAALRVVLRDALASGQDLAIDLGETGKWDLTGLQLLVSAVQTARSQKNVIRFLKVPRTCTEIAERSGLGEWLISASE